MMIVETRPLFLYQGSFVNKRDTDTLVPLQVRTITGAGLVWRRAASQL